MKKNQKGFSAILLILVIFIILAGVCVYYMYTQDTKIIHVEEYYAENSINEARRYYYNQLEEPSKIMYSTILENIDALKNGNEMIEFPTSLSDSIKKLETEESNNYFQSAWDAISLDNVELFYVNTSNLSLQTKKWSLLSLKSYEFTLKPYEGRTYYTSTFSNRYGVEEAIAQVDQIVDDVLAEANGSVYDKVKYVHDWIVDNFEYDTNDRKDKDNIYGAFVNKKVVCEGYAEAFKYMLNKLEIPCILVYGEGIDSNGKSEAHAWNYVKMPDNKWYAVDTTWDDPIYVGGGSRIFKSNTHKYDNFLKGSEKFNVSHINNGDVSGTGQNFKYPELSETDYKEQKWGS